MNTYADKTLENKSQAVANNSPKLQSNDASAFQFADIRPEDIAQRKLQEAINNSPRVQQLKAYQEMANNFTTQTVQRKEILEEETLQGKFSTTQLEEKVMPNNTGLPDNLKSGIESLSGMNMDHVKVHYNSDKPAQLNAHAYAQSSEIHVATGQEKHVSHDAWHVVQQAQGRVKPTMQMKGNTLVNDDAGLENEADVMGGNALKLSQLVQNKKDTTTQLKQIHETSSFSGLGLAPTGHTFSVSDGELNKSNADLFAVSEEVEPVENKAEALGNLAGTAAVLGNKIKGAVKKEGGKESKTGYTISNENLNKEDVQTIDPFTHGQVQIYGGTDYVCLMYQHTNGFDGYVSGIEEGKVEAPSVYAKNFQKSMKNGKNTALLDGDQAPTDGHFSNLHEKTKAQNLLGLASNDGHKDKADAITKLAGEGARFQWVRNNIDSITDSTKFIIGYTEHGKAVITFLNLWSTWKEWFKGEYDISEDDQRRILLDRANKKQIKTKNKVVRITYE